MREIQIHLTIRQLPNGKVEVLTNDTPPAIGRALTPAQSLAMDLLRQCRQYADSVVFHPTQPPLLAFARRFLDPEDLGYAVSPIVRDDARAAIGIPPTEARA